MGPEGFYQRVVLVIVWSGGTRRLASGRGRCPAQVRVGRSELTPRRTSPIRRSERGVEATGRGCGGHGPTHGLGCLT